MICTHRRRSTLIIGLVLSIVCLNTVRAADDDDDDNPKGSNPPTLAAKAASRFPQPVVVGTLYDRTVLQPLESQPVLGHVRGLVRNVGGGIDVIVGYGGILGYGARPIAVPVEAVVLSGQFVEIVEFAPEQLDRFPTYAGAGTPVGPQEVVRIGLAKPSH